VEHEVSLQSARSILEAIDKEKHEVLLIAIDKEGRWYRSEVSDFLDHADDPSSIRLGTLRDEVALVPGSRENQLVSLRTFRSAGRVDVIFPVLHGPFGEDGTVQGLLRLLGLPFVGARVLGSAVAMDKDVAKRLLRDAGIPTARFIVFHRSPGMRIDFEETARRLGLPVFVKPAGLGSSVGISRVENREHFDSAVEKAFAYDNKILVEEAVEGREIECSVLGNDSPVASVPGEVIPRHDFYSYEAKYIDEKGARLEIPARLPDRTIREVQDLAIRTFRALCCEGMARVDFFVRKDGEILVNELNTIPGFTKISMYPKLWEASGISYGELIDRLIELALERSEREREVRTSFVPAGS